MNFRSISLMINLPDGTSAEAAKALEEKLVAFCNDNTISATLTYDAFVSVGPAPVPKPAPAPPAAPTPSTSTVSSTGQQPQNAGTPPAS